MIAADVLLHLGHDLMLAFVVANRQLERVVQLGKTLGIELDVENRADDLNHAADIPGGCCGSHS